MSTRPENSDIETLETYRVAFNNAEIQTEIATALNAIGYDTTVMARGKALYDKASAEFDTNIRKDD